MLFIDNTKKNESRHFLLQWLGQFHKMVLGLAQDLDFYGEFSCSIHLLQISVSDNEWCMYL